MLLHFVSRRTKSRMRSLWRQDQSLRAKMEACSSGHQPLPRYVTIRWNNIHFLITTIQTAPYTDDLASVSPSAAGSDDQDDDEWKPSVNGDEETQEDFDTPKKRTHKKARRVQDPPQEVEEMMKALHITNEDMKNGFEARNLQYFPNKLSRADDKDAEDSTTSITQNRHHSAS